MIRWMVSYVSRHFHTTTETKVSVGHFGSSIELNFGSIKVSNTSVVLPVHWFGSVFDLNCPATFRKSYTKCQKNKAIFANVTFTTTVRKIQQKRYTPVHQTCHIQICNSKMMPLTLQELVLWIQTIYKKNKYCQSLSFDPCDVGYSCWTDNI